MRENSSFSRLVLKVSAALLASFSVSCNDGAHAFLARTWSADRQCLDILRAIDVMDGADAVSGCAVRCLKTRSTPTVLYVTSMCDENPRSLDAVGSTDTECAKAIGAWQRGLQCGDGGP